MATNYCKNSGLIHICTTCESAQGQQNCEFSEKAQAKTKTRACMFLSMDEYCQNINAQKGAKSDD